MPKFLASLRHCTPPTRDISSNHQNELNFWWSILETIQDFNVREEGLWIISLTVVENLVHTLLKLERNDPLLNAETVKTSLELILATHVFLSFIQIIEHL